MAILKRALELALYWVVSAIVRGAALLLASRSRTAAPPKVSIVLMNAWAIGGTIRSTLQLAGLLAETHEVEVVSVIRRRDKPLFEFPQGVIVTALDDRRASVADRRGRAQRVLGAVGGRLLHPGDRARLGTTLWTDMQLLRKLCVSSRRGRVGAVHQTNAAFGNHMHPRFSDFAARRNMQ